MRLIYKVVLFFFITYSVMMIWTILTYEPVTAQSLKYCETSDDCVRVRANCCGCEQGGEDTCINKNFVERWDNSMTNECGNTMCIQVYNCPNASCQCLNNTCVFKI